MERLEAAHQHPRIQQVDVQYRGDEPILQAAQAGDEILRFRGYGDDFHGGVVFLEPPRYAHQSAAGAETADEQIHIRHRRHDFRPGGFVMRPRIAAIAVLVHH